MIEQEQNYLGLKWLKWTKLIHKMLVEIQILVQ